MVKQDHFSGKVICLTKISLLLIIMVWLYGVWEVFSTGFSSRAISSVVISFCAVFLVVRLLPKRWKQMKRIEALRRNQGEAALYDMQIETDGMKCSLPIILSTHLSPAAIVLLAVLWFAIGAVTLLGGSPGSLVVFWSDLLWVVLGAIFLGLIGIQKYQRIEATQQGLMVQRGWKQRSISWEQAKLFAALRLLSPESMPVQYELSSAQTLLRWEAHYPKGMMITSPRQKQEYEQRLRDLLSSIRIHTGLPFLDLC